MKAAPRKRKRTAQVTALALGLVPLLSIAGAGVYLIGKGIARGGASGAVDIVGGAFVLLLGCGLLLVARAVVRRAVRRVRPGEGTPALELGVFDRRFLPGDQVVGQVKVTHGGYARAIDVSLSCRDRSGSVSGTSWSISSHLLVDSAVAAGSTLPFTFSLPPPSYADVDAEIWWEVQVRCAAFRDVSAVTRLEVTPSPPHASSIGAAN